MNTFLTKMRALLGMLGLLLGAVNANAQYTLPDTLSPSATYSILVAEPSADDVYTLYGHAGIRIHDEAQGLDVTFNYGIFDFSDDFLSRFVRGETDYIVLPQQTDSYMSEYLGRGSNVTEIVMHMMPEELERAWHFLLWNILPENRTYRYNFFYDNCSTRPLVVYLEAIGDPGVFTKDPTQVRSWRGEINELESRMPWLVLGTDLALGAKTDSQMEPKDEVFLPHLLAERLSSGTIQRLDGKQIVAEVRHYERWVAPEEQSSPWTFILHPITIAALMLLLAIASLAHSIQQGKICKWHIYMVFALAGLAGGVIFYIACLSEHPHRTPNYNLWVLHPLHLLLVIPAMAFPQGKRVAYLYHFANFVAQSAFLLSAYFLPQSFHIALLFLSAALGTLSLAYIISYRKQTEKLHNRA